jgi:hypothetical protein
MAGESSFTYSVGRSNNGHMLACKVINVAASSGLLSPAITGNVGIISSMLPTFTVMVGWSGFTEIK